MRHRHAISDADRARIKDLLPGRPGQHGEVAKDNRLFLDAVLWIAKIGAPWRDLPARFGDWNSTWRRFARRARKGVWVRVFEALQDPDLEWLILDSTIIRAHPRAAGARASAGARGTGRGQPVAPRTPPRRPRSSTPKDSAPATRTRRAPSPGPGRAD
jgi:transposase